MNQMTIRQPSKICWYDSCPFGVGGFLLSGRAWRIRIPESSLLYGLDIANNVLEFLGMMVTIWLVLVECDETSSQQDCILALGDNTSATGWLFPPRLALLQDGPAHSSETGSFGHRKLPLPRQSTHQRGQKHSLRPPKLCWGHAWQDSSSCPRLSFRSCSNRAFALLLAPVDSSRFQHLAPIQRDFLLRHSGAANARIILYSKQEPAHENKDRVWRRWTSFCAEAGLNSDPFLSELQQPETELIMRSFLSLYRMARWRPTGAILGQRPRPVVSSTVRDAAGHLASSFRSHFQQSPFHLEGSSQLLPTIRTLLKAFDNSDPPPERQKAITPKFLRQFFKFLSAEPTAGSASTMAHIADLVLGAFFFAMRSCEHTKSVPLGQTKRVRMGCFVFRTASRRVLLHRDPKLLHHAHFVTIVFEDQKNGKKMDARTHSRSGHKFLCPVLRWGSAVQRIIATIPNWTESTTLCSTVLDAEPIEIGNAFVRKLLRHTCSTFGGFKTFGFDPHEIGNKFLRSGAAMSLFLMDHPPAKIMILGRWSSDAFLVCIRPQVLKWTNNMSCDMIHLDSFFDAPCRDLVAPDDPRTRKRLQASFNGQDNIVTIPKFCIHH
jgi:hypothetical protein